MPDWETKKLGDVAKLKNGYAFKSKEYSDEGVPVIRISDINDNLVTTKAAKRIPMKDEYKGYKIEENSILIAMSGATTGKFGIFRSDEIALQNQRVGKFEYDENKLSNQFLYYLLYNLKRQILKEAYGGAQPNISSKKIESMEVKIPPISTQNRIVEKIEELFSELDHGVENLKKAQKQLKTYRQAVLKDAFEGKLTKEWREQQEDLPSPEELLEQIKAERKAHRQREIAEWKKEVEQWEEDGGKVKKPTKPRKSRSVDELTEDELSELHDLPENWFWGKINDITLRVEYGTSNKSLDEGKIPVLRMGNMQNGKIDWNDLKYSNDQKDNEEYLLQEEDVLFNRTNSPELVGKAVIYQGERPSIFAGYLIRLNHIRKIMNGYYLNYFLNSVTAKNHGNKVKTDGVNQSNINGTKLVNYPIPLCSRKEQDQIVQEIESRLSVIDQLEQTINQNLQKAEAFRQSILKKAFSGKLVEV